MRSGRVSWGETIYIVTPSHERTNIVVVCCCCVVREMEAAVARARRDAEHDPAFQSTRAQMAERLEALQQEAEKYKWVATMDIVVRPPHPRPPPPTHCFASPPPPPRDVNSFLLLWLCIPSGFLVVVEKPDRSSFTFAFTLLVPCASTPAALGPPSPLCATRRQAYAREYRRRKAALEKLIDLQVRRGYLNSWPFARPHVPLHTRMPHPCCVLALKTPHTVTT